MQGFSFFFFPCIKSTDLQVRVIKHKVKVWERSAIPGISQYYSSDIRSFSPANAVAFSTLKLLQQSVATIETICTYTTISLKTPQNNTPPPFPTPDRRSWLWWNHRSTKPFSIADKTEGKKCLDQLQDVLLNHLALEISTVKVSVLT